MPTDMNFHLMWGSSIVKRIADILKLRIYQYPPIYKADAGPMAHPLRPHFYIKVLILLFLSDIVIFLVFFVCKELNSVFAHLSLKEGLTVFRGPEFSSDVGSNTVKRIADVLKFRIYQYPQDAGPMAHPVQPHSYIKMDNFYTGKLLFHCISE
ncbi:unnamed protein product [Coffea canephora]|uniref:Uncharacterized protein n=1 Tax=Coffea canephora TaxID=49390 RepID=A0A068V5L7_COFCA|nr:unnamed protein product [Coffea canephora]